MNFDWIEFMTRSLIWLDSWLDGDEGKTSGGLPSLYREIQKVIIALHEENRKSITIMIDDISLMEVAANGSTNHVLDFLHYCHTLTLEFVRQ